MSQERSVRDKALKRAIEFGAIQDTPMDEKKILSVAKYFANFLRNKQDTNPGNSKDPEPVDLQ